MAVVEITRYAVVEERVADYLERRPAIDAALRGMPGMHSVMFGRLDVRRFVDVVVWADRTAATQAQQAAMSDERFTPLFEWLEDVSMELAEVIDA